MTVNDKQVGGSHYKSKIQHWDYVVANGLGYFEGQITKYVTRWRGKNGVEDLRKALHFLDKLIELKLKWGWWGWLVRLYQRCLGYAAGGKVARKLRVVQYADANELSYYEELIIGYVTSWREDNGVDDLVTARYLLETLITREIGRLACVAEMKLKRRARRKELALLKMTSKKSLDLEMLASEAQSQNDIMQSKKLEAIND